MCIFVHEKLIFKQRVDITKIEDDFELLSIEIINKNTKNIIVNNCYRLPGGKVRPLKKQIRNAFQKLYRENKKVFMVGNFNLNSLDYSTNTKVKNFIDLMFSNGLISVVNRPTRVTKHNASCIDHRCLPPPPPPNLFSLKKAQPL